MGPFDMTPAEIAAHVERLVLALQDQHSSRPLKPHDFAVRGDVGRRIAVALGWREAAWAMDFWCLPGALALGSWRAMRRIKLPTDVVEVVIVVASPGDVDALAQSRGG